MNQSDTNTRPPVDDEIVRIVDYVRDFQPREEAYATAAVCLMDSIGCALMALSHDACTRHLGPIVAGGEVENGARVIGTNYQLDPVKAAFDNGALIRWLDFNDTWLAAEWGHPSDNLAAVWAVADYLSRQRRADYSVRDMLTAMIKAHEIQGVLALENSLNRAGLDHVAFVKIASAAVAAHLFGASREQTLSAVSHACVDGQSLRTYRHAPNTGSRKSWAAGDAASRGVRLAMMAIAGEGDIPAALSAEKWGFYAVSFGGKRFKLARRFDSYVMENILFKVSFPAEFHAQTAVEAAIKLHPQVKDRLADIRQVEIKTQESAVRIISKTGALYNPADRDHCLQYMTAVGLIFGELTADHYEDAAAADPRIDALRDKMTVSEEPRYSADYLHPDKRSIANAVRVLFADGTATECAEVEYPLGHKRRRDESLPHLREKFNAAANAAFGAGRRQSLTALFDDPEKLQKLAVREFTDLFAR